MLIIFVYATILLVYYILLKYHIPLSSSHQNSSQSCFGLVLLGSPLSRTQLYNEGARAGNNLESLTPQAGKGWEDCWGFTQAPTEKDTECVEMQHPPIGQAEPYTTVSPEETYKTLSTSKWREEQLILKGKETGYQTAGENT